MLKDLSDQLNVWKNLPNTCDRKSLVRARIRFRPIILNELDQQECRPHEQQLVSLTLPA